MNTAGRKTKVIPLIILTVKSPFFSDYVREKHDSGHIIGRRITGEDRRQWETNKAEQSGVCLCYEQHICSSGLRNRAE